MSSNSPPQPSILARRHDDCIPCRLVSGFGVIGMGVYVYSQAKQRPAGIGRNAIFVISCAAGLVGVTRLLDIYPFGQTKRPNLNDQ